MGYPTPTRLPPTQVKIWELRSEGPHPVSPKDGETTMGQPGND